MAAAGGRGAGAADAAGAMADQAAVVGQAAADADAAPGDRAAAVVDPAGPAEDVARAAEDVDRAEAADAGLALAAPPAEVGADALAQARQASQAASWPQAWHLAGAAARAVRRVRAQGARGRLADQPPDRGCPYRDDPQDQAWRQGLDQRVPGQAGDEEAGRDSHGLGQGLARRLGRRRQAGARDVRAGRRTRAAGPRRDPPGRAQAPREVEVRAARGLR